DAEVVQDVIARGNRHGFVRADAQVFAGAVVAGAQLAVVVQRVAVWRRVAVGVVQGAGEGFARGCGDAGDRRPGLRPHRARNRGVARAGDVAVGRDVARVATDAAGGGPIAGGGIAAELDVIEAYQAEVGRDDGGDGEGLHVARRLPQYPGEHQRDGIAPRHSPPAGNSHRV